MMSKINDKPRFVVCAAVRERGGDVIFCGPRHFDETMHKQIAAAGMMGKAIEFEQGFIDQRGVFMDREEAMCVAKAARQPIDFEWGCSGSFSTLYSEGLY